MSDPAFWVGVAFAIFIGALIYLRVPRMVSDALDRRAETIAGELEEARRLREEAQALLASYQRKQRDAAAEAEEIVAHAEAEAGRATEEARREFEELAARRTRMASEKIAQAEANAVKEVREAAIGLAARAAERLLREHVDPARSKDLIDKSIDDVRRKLH